MIAPLLSVIERFLAHVAVELLAVDPRLAVIKNRGQPIFDAGVLALLVMRPTLSFQGCLSAERPLDRLSDI